MSRLESIKSIVGRSRVLLLGAFVLAVFGAMGFLNLAMTTASARAEHDQELARVERLEQQNVILQQELNRAQRDEHIGWLAWDYYGRVPPGVGVIERMGEDAPAVAPEPEPQRTWWSDFLRRLGIN
jgi:hypothetical protein